MINRTNTRAAVLVAASVLLLACGKEAAEANAADANTSAENAAVASNDVTTTAAPAENAVVPAAATGELSPDYMLGKWSAMDEDCSDTLEFRKDGTVVTPIGEAKWTLVGDKLTLDYGDGSNQPSSTIKVLSAERIEITRGSGGKETERRCS